MLPSMPSGSSSARMLATWFVKVQPLLRAPIRLVDLLLHARAVEGAIGKRVDREHVEVRRAARNADEARQRSRLRRVRRRRHRRAADRFPSAASGDTWRFTDGRCVPSAASISLQRLAGMNVGAVGEVRRAGKVKLHHAPLRPQPVDALDRAGSWSMACTSTLVPIPLSSVMVSSPPRCSRNSSRPASRSRCRPAPRESHASCQSAKPSRSSKRAHAHVGARRQQPGKHRIARVEGDADGHGLAVAQLIVRQRLELVRGPVAEIERPAAAALERIAAVADLPHVQQRAVTDQPLERLGGEQRQRLGLLFEPVEEGAVADQRDLDRLGHAGALVAPGTARR